MPINKDLKDKAQKTREDGVFTLKLDEGVSLATLVSFAQDMFPSVSTDDMGVWARGDDDELVCLGARRRSSCIELTSALRLASAVAVG